MGWGGGIIIHKTHIFQRSTVYYIVAFLKFPPENPTLHHEKTDMSNNNNQSEKTSFWTHEHMWKIARYTKHMQYSFIYRKLNTAK